jgi:hypothetical protein
LARANLSFVDLSAVSLNGVSSGNVTGNPKLPNNWLLISGYLVGPEANLDGAELSQKDLSGASLKGATLNGANLIGSRLVRVDMAAVTLRFASLSQADLSGANLAGADLQGAELGESNLSGVNLSGAKLTGSFIGGANFRGSQFDGALANGVEGVPEELPIGWFLIDGLIARQFSFERLPAINGATQVGETLAVQMSAPAPGAKLEYQWLQDGLEILGASKDTYLLKPEDFGHQISVEVSASKQDYFSTSIRSNAATVQLGTIKSASKPTIGGVLKVGETLSASPNQWDNGVTFSYQWARNGLAILGATSATYPLTIADAGSTISLQATGSKPGYTTVSKISEPMAIPLATMLSSTPKIAGTAKVGSTLKAVTSSWVSGSKVSYKWLANGLAVKGETSSSLKLTAALKGKKISVSVSQTASGYSTAVKVSATVLVKS